MKKIAMFLAVAAMAATASAYVLNLRPGLNGVAPGGKIVAAEVVTSNATATVAIESVQALTVRTNAYAEVSTRHTVYTFTVTNFTGGASVSTNLWDRFNGGDWLADVETSPGVTNKISRIVGGVTWVDTNVVQNVVVGRLPKETYFVTNSLMSVTAAGHRGISTNAVFWLAGDLLVTGASEDDVIAVCVEK